MNHSSFKSDISLRTPEASDGASVYQLVAQCPPLDTNSLYCNLLQCSHFYHTSVAAESQGNLVGFISGYIIPDRPDTLFIWQVAVGEQARGQGLATRMLVDILSRSQCERVTHLETTITESNKASWALFKGFANNVVSAGINTTTMFCQDKHFDGKHSTEILVRIGPFKKLVKTDRQTAITNVA